jgi:hypothetical protein
MRRGCIVVDVNEMGRRDGRTDGPVTNICAHEDDMVDVQNKDTRQMINIPSDGVTTGRSSLSDSGCARRLNGAGGGGFGRPGRRWKS